MAAFASLIAVLTTTVALLALVGLAAHVQPSRSSPHSPTYVAAVVEFHRTEWSNATTSAQRVALNLRRIQRHIAQLLDAVDIVVFPELAIHESVDQAVGVPPAAAGIVPCRNASYADSPIIGGLSCAAQSRHVYVAVNLYTNDTAGLVYNTNVVFDRSGAVVSVYRKFNVYYERGISSTGAAPDNATFATDFGVRFGHLICFDILFDRPAHALLADGVRDFLFPSLWYSELPALTAVQLQQGWAQAHGVNLLAAGIARRQQGSTGSGIFSGAAGALGAVAMGTSEYGTDEILVHVVPKLPGAIETTTDYDNATTAARLNTPLASVQLMRENLTVVAWRPLEASAAPMQQQLCTAAGFCCTFVYQLVYGEPHVGGVEAPDALVPPVQYEYVAAVQNGTRTFGGSAEQLGVLSCSVIGCWDSADLETCARAHPKGAALHQRLVFKELHVEGTFRRAESMVVPTTLVPALVPLPIEAYEWEDEGAALERVDAK